MSQPFVMARRTLLSLLPLVALLVLVALSSASVALAGDLVPPADTLRLRFHSFNPRLCVMTEHPKVRVAFELSAPASVSLTILDWDLEKVASVAGKFSAGEGVLEWNGAFDARKPEDGVFLFSLTARNEAGLVAHYNPGLASGLDELSLVKSEYDSKTRKVAFNLPKLGMVRIRVYSQNNMVLRSLLEWTPHLAGRHSYVWDGLDASSHPVQTEGVQVAVAAYSLPENAFIMSGTGSSKPPRTRELQMAWQALPELEGKFMHARMPRERSRDFQLSLQFASDERVLERKDALPFAGPLRVRVNASAEHARQMMDERFEICLYMDGVLLLEDEDGLIPFSFALKPEGLNPGEHLLSISVISAVEHVGAVSQILVIPPAQNQPTPQQIEKKEK